MPESKLEIIKVVSLVIMANSSNPLNLKVSETNANSTSTVMTNTRVGQFVVKIRWSLTNVIWKRAGHANTNLRIRAI